MDDTENSNVTDFPGRGRPATSGPKWPQSSPSPETVALLTTCLALVRPVGFSDDNARDWLRVAAQEIADIRLDILEYACREARRKATHHAQIVPAIVAAADEWRGLHTFRCASTEEFTALPPPPPLSQEQFEVIVAERSLALSVALDRKQIVSRGDGRFELA